MIRHSLTIAFRNFQRHKNSFFINLIGLSTGLASALLIFLWVNDEIQINKFHEHGNRIYQVMEHQQYAEGIMTTTSTPGLLAETLVEEIPEIEFGTPLNWQRTFTLSVGQHSIKSKGHHVRPDFFKIFTYPLVMGQKEEVLTDLNGIVLSESTAKKLFGTTEIAIGKTIQLDHEEDYIVSGIFADVPKSSSYQFDFLLSFEKFKKENEWVLSWGNNSPPTVVLVKEGADIASINEKIAGFIKARNEDSNVTLFLQPFEERYLYSRYENGQLIGGRIEYVRLFSIIALFILVIACINFMNLSTARASRRAKEVGVKKAIGAHREALIGQYLSESVIISLLSLLIAILMVFLLLPKFNLLTEKELALELDPKMIVGFLSISILTGLLAGSYPALYLSSFKPVTVLKGDIRSSLGELWARRGLVVFQFTLSIILIVAVLVVYNQIQFVQTQNLGYEKDQLIYFSKDGKLVDQSEAFLEEARKLSGIASISTVGHSLIGRQNNTSGLEWEGKNPDDRILFENVRVDFDLLETIGVDILEGRSFSREFSTDTSKIIFNEAAIKVMGMQDPIGKTIKLWERFDMEIIGVVKDFHFQSLHENVKPLFFRLDPATTWTVMARLEAGKEQAALQQLGEFYENFNSGFSFDFKFTDEEYARQYAAEQRVASLSRYFAGLAILISCLGLFGLAAFTADRKKKEIGIRKVLGASVFDIVSLLTKDFTRLVVISILAGLPIAYFLSRQWLERFAYRIDLNLWTFLIAGILVLFISWFTVGSQAISSATINPSDCLQEE